MVVKGIVSNYFGYVPGPHLEMTWDLVFRILLRECLRGLILGFVSLGLVELIALWDQGNAAGGLDFWPATSEGEPQLRPASEDAGSVVSWKWVLTGLLVVSVAVVAW